MAARPGILGVLGGWIAGVLAIAVASLVIQSGAIDEPASAEAARPPASTVTSLATTTSTTTTTTTTSAPATTTTTPPTTSTTAEAARTSGPTLLVWTYGGMPPSLIEGIANLDQVTSITVVGGDLVRLLRTTDADGRPIDTAPTWWAYPIDALAIDPSSFATFVPEADRPVVASLRPGEVILTQTSAELRRIGPGGTMTFGPDDVALTVAAIVPDRSGSGAEVLVHQADAATIGIDSTRFVLLRDTDRAAVEVAIEALTPTNKRLSLRGSDQAAWLRHGDRVDPQILVKKAFGEFVFHDGNPGERDILIDPAWLEANIVTETVPLLGEVTCHRLVLPVVRDAMRELEAAGRSDAVHASNFAGCQYSRRIAPGAGLSRHSWGIALDINVGSDPRGDYATQDRALTDALVSRGFNWGGDWVNFPDPAHYEMKAT